MGWRHAGWPLGLAISLLFQAPVEARHRRRGGRPSKVSQIAPLTKGGLPNVQAAAAIVVDMADGRVLYGKNPDAARFIASTTKIFVAMVVRKHKLDLDGITEITTADKLSGRGGSRTHLYEGEHYKNLDLLRAMLIASDNRAPTALGRAVGLDAEHLVGEMNALAKQLKLGGTTFTSPNGLEGNQSTPRDMATAMRALLKDPLLAEIVSTKAASIVSTDEKKPKRINYANTNRLIHNDANHILGGKTGYTDQALYCLVVASEIDGRKVCVVLLGAFGELTRYADYNRIKNWVSGKQADPKADAVPEVEGGDEGAAGDGAAGGK